VPNHFLHFNLLLGKRVPKLLVTYGMHAWIIWIQVLKFTADVVGWKDPLKNNVFGDPTTSLVRYLVKLRVLENMKVPNINCVNHAQVYCYSSWGCLVPPRAPCSTPPLPLVFIYLAHKYNLFHLSHFFQINK